MILKAGKRKIGRMLALVMAVSLMMCIPAQAASHDLLDGKINVFDSDSNSSILDNGTVTITAKGSIISKKTVTVTITNNSGTKAEISFNYSASSTNSFTVDGASANASGTYNKQLEVNGTATLVIQSKSGFSGTTATLTLSNFGCTPVAESSNVTINYDSALGSVTANKSPVSVGGVVEGVTPTDGVALVAAANGSTFLGWINEDTGEILSTVASYTLKPAQNMTVKAVFAKDGATPWFGVGAAAQKSEGTGLLGMSKLYYFQVGTSYLFDDLNVAATYAAANSTKAIVLMNDGTLPAGTYTIPVGVTLLIPFDNQNTMYTTEAQSVTPLESDEKTTKELTVTAYRTLTLGENATLNVNGAISVSAKHRYAQGGRPDGGSPTDDVAFINMSQGSSITINDGGMLYAYGYITGSGTVTAKSGATVYENFQIMDFRGGSQSTDMGNGVFPMSQYYVQNIVVPLYLESGAAEYAMSTIYMSSSKFQTAVQFIGPTNSMFCLTSGKVCKYYDSSRDRLVVELDGNVTVSPVTLSLGTGSINSKNYELAINGNITVTQKSGSNLTVSQDMALIPGAEFNIASGATMNVSANVYAYDLDEWGNYCGPSDQRMIPLRYVPVDGYYKRTAADLKDAEVLVNGILDISGGAGYTTTGGAKIYSTDAGKVIAKSGDETKTCQYLQTKSQYVDIPITPAKLKNADGTFVQSGTNTYTYVNSKWIPQNGYEVYDGSSIYYSYENINTAISDAQDNSDHKVTAYGANTLSGTIDLLGCNIVAVDGDALTLADGANIIDTTTNGFLVPDENGKVPTPGTINLPLSGVYSPTTGAQVGKHYAAIPIYGEDGETVVGTQFHRVAVAVTAVRFWLNSGTAYMTFEGQFRGTPQGLTALDDLGFKIGNDYAMYAAENGIDTIKDASPEAGYSEFIYYSTEVDLDTTVQACMEFDEIPAVGTLHTGLLRDALTKAMAEYTNDAEKVEENTPEYQAAYNYLNS